MTRVLIISQTDIYGGVGHMLFELCKHFDKRKLHFDILYYKKPAEAELDIIHNLGSDFFLIPRWSKHLIRFIEEINEFYRNHYYDCIYIQASTAMMIMYTFPLWKKNNVKIICSSHQVFVKGILNNIFHRFFRYILIKKTDIYLAVSKKAAIHMYGNKIANNNRYTFLHNGIETNKFIYNTDIRADIRKHLGLNNKYVIGNISCFRPRKNHTFIIDVFNIVYKKKPEAILLLVGRGELEEQIKQQVNKLGIENSVIFYGTTQDVPSILQAVDVFFLPSLYEALGIVAIEAQAAGLPVVASSEVAEEAAVTPLFHYMDLHKDSLEDWADKLLSFKHFNRTDTHELVKQSGFDISVTAKMLEDLFISQ